MRSSRRRDEGDGRFSETRFHLRPLRFRFAFLKSTPSPACIVSNTPTHKIEL